MPLSLENLSSLYSVNKNYLSTRFHKEVGMTVTDYINLSRVRRALDLLGTTAMTMPEIAERCGFSDANYLTRRFRKVYGKTPTEYRKSLHRKYRQKTTNFCQTVVQYMRLKNRQNLFRKRRDKNETIIM